MSHILAIDQGTTSTRSLIFDANLQVVATGQQEFTQHFPKSGWVEHDAMDLWNTTVATAKEALAAAQLAAADIAAIGITNQRETTLVWDKATGKPVYNAIVWQDRRTAATCDKLTAEGFLDNVREQTGLLLDPYFSSTKLAWILDSDPTIRVRAEAGELLFGTVDTWLIWNFTGGKRHVTDATNAARTMLYNIHTGQWSEDICAKLNIPMQMLPEVLDCAADFGITDADILGAELPIYGVAGDQQAATIGQACFEPGMLKSTYGTGCFALLNTGDKAVLSNNRLLTTIAYQLDGKTTYALEGSIFIAGAVVQWLRDGLKIVESASQTQAMADAADDSQELIVVPAFTGMGAPYWNAGCRGAVYGLSRNSGPNEFAKAALQ
ncbi:MAG: glycerol kinase GlpK, partial [Gammaproteobacteria bacterium]|nr:glycerol kinase GlpK [Gammaproteobacteria bacterium]